MASPVDSLLQSVRSSIASGDTEAAFRELIEFVRFVNSPPSRWGQVLASRELDQLCVELAAVVAARPAVSGPVVPEAAHQFPQVYVATELYHTGGHGAWIRDLITCQPDRHHVVIITDLHGRTKRDAITAAWQADNVTLLWADAAASLTDRAVWLAAQLNAYAHGRIFLVTHQEDAPAIAGAIAAKAPRLFFCHHADYTLTLGIYLPGAGHIDLSPYSWRHCQDALGVERVVYLPLVSPEVPARPASDFRWGADEDEFTTCSAGAGQKFEFPYDYHYADLIPERLVLAKGRHIHIGPLSGPFLERLRAGCTAAGVAPERIVHVPHTPSLHEALTEYRVSLYLGSFPLGGAKSTIDVMASGTPILGHVNYGHEYFGVQGLLYPEARIWHTPEEFARMVSQWNALELTEQARAARQHWERRHRPALLADLLSSLSPGGGYEPAPQAPVPQNPLRRILETWEDSPSEWDAHQQDLQRMEKRQEKLARELEKAQAALEKLSTRAARDAAALERIRGSVAWKCVKWMVR